MIHLALLLALAQSDTGEMSMALRREVAATTHARMRWGDISDVRDALQRAYDARGWRPFWSTSGTMTPAGRRLLGELDSARTRGLDPADYDAPMLDRAVAGLSPANVLDAAEVDVRMSVAAARHALALSRGRIDPRLLHPLLPAPADSADIAGLLGELALSGRPDTILRNLEPQHATYVQLVALLARYRGLQAQRTGGTDSSALRVRQIELALERWRWLPHSAAAPWIVVNVPAFRLYALRSDREERGDLLRMKVVAGEATEHPTPLMVTQIVAVQFHPPWLVPATIALREIRPAALRDSFFLSHQHYELLSRDSVVAATRANIARIGTGIDVRQTPGPWNALGAIKFVTPNPAAVFMHDTPARADFDRAARAFSHGCIRVETPMALAEFALTGNAAWPADRIEDALADTVTLTVALKRPIPVFVLYQTLVPDGSGGLITYPDAYAFDRKLEAMLRAGFPYRSTLVP